MLRTYINEPIFASAGAPCCPGDPRPAIIWNSTQMDEMYKKFEDNIDMLIEDFKRWYEKPVDWESIFDSLFNDEYDKYIEKFKVPGND
jgi:hypothetical protein